jgi:hypothetical protein
MKLTWLVALTLAFGCGQQASNDRTVNDSITTLPSEGGSTVAAVEPETSDALVKRLTPLKDRPSVRSTASWRMRNDALIITINDIDDDEMTNQFRTGLFGKDPRGNWVSMLDHELIDGIFDTLIDLDQDYNDELIINNKMQTSAGGTDTYILYAVGQKLPYVKVDPFATAVVGANAYVESTACKIEYAPGTENSIKVTQTTTSTDEGGNAKSRTEINLFHWDGMKLTKRNQPR